MSVSPRDLFLIRNGKLRLPRFSETHVQDCGIVPARAGLGTVLANMAYFGVAPSRVLFDLLASLTPEGLSLFWMQTRPQLAAATGEDRDMSAHVVYRNFPREVLDMPEADYWIRQIGMYLGLPNALFTEEEDPRAALDERIELRILEVAGIDTDTQILETLQASGTSWTDLDVAAMLEIIDTLPRPLVIDTGDFRFRANGIRMATEAFPREDVEIRTSSATDVLRLAAALSGADPELRRPPRFRRFNRAERRRFVALLEGCSALETDFGRRREIWKRFLSRLHPGEMKAPRVSAAYHDLHCGSKSRVAARIEAGFRDGDPAVLGCLSTDPGTFMRQLHRAYGSFGRQAFEAFLESAPALSTEQLLRLERYFRTAAGRTSFLVRPRGNWSKAQILPNTKPAIEGDDLSLLLEGIGALLGRRLAARVPEGVSLDPAVCNIALKSNGQELAPYGRGTRFPIPPQMTFLRSASYWACPSPNNIWFDNSWNFFHADWTPAGCCCWNMVEFETGAVFSGDPTNSKDLQGRGCQMIDLYPDRLREAGVRYALWSLLCYNLIPFSEAREVLATLQWGEEAQSGNLFEPARAQMVFPVTGTDLVKAIAFVDLETRELVYLDAGLAANVLSAEKNCASLARRMPAVSEHLCSLPRVGDLFAHAPAGPTPILFSDAGTDIQGRAWVFQRTNPENRVDQIDLDAILAETGTGSTGG